jgi:hypothetical protein
MRSGRVPETTRESWAGIDSALRDGHRGLPRGSLAQLLTDHRGREIRAKGGTLTEAQILDWAFQDQALTGRWPTAASGVVLAEPSEHWSRINMALWRGYRGLPGEDSLSLLLRRHGCVGHKRAWTPAENELVRALPAQEAAQQTGRTLGAVRCRRSFLGLPDGRRKNRLQEAE